MIYIIGNTKEGYVKVGKAFCTYNGRVSRIDSLQTGSPFDLYVLKTYPLEDYYEKRIHKELEEIRIRGEWFRYDVEVLDRVFKRYGFGFEYDSRSELPEYAHKMTYYAELTNHMFCEIMKYTDMYGIENFVNIAIKEKLEREYNVVE